RGAPHFHCYIKDRIEILGLVKAWNRIIGTADGDGFGYMDSVDIRKFRRPYRKAAYATKKAGYATKSAQKVVPDGFENVGRFWGVWGKPVAAQTIQLSPSIGHRVARVIRKLYQKQRKTWAYQQKRFKDNGVSGFV